MHVQIDSESWCPVPDYEGRYEVSDRGRVRSLTRQVEDSVGRVRTFRGRVLSPGSQPPLGHLHVNLSTEGRKRTFAVHALVLMAFVSPRPVGQECCHANGDPRDNRLENLRWGTRFDNVGDALGHGTHWQARKTHCPQGHLYDAENTSGSRGVRRCRRCNRHQSAQRYAARADVQHGTHVSSRKTACKNGHPFSEENTRLTPRGRVCKACDHARGATGRAKRKARL